MDGEHNNGINRTRFELAVYSQSFALAGYAGRYALAQDDYLLFTLSYAADQIHILQSRL